ncbi:hypothetical protein ACMT4L_07055 [Deinococcus sp. A31D244]|uniref:hypothetical protein n=1 Tax=Deinococcus sp. A31D244 TaxID=3397675 RepID=UPI0039E10CA3
MLKQIAGTELQRVIPLDIIEYLGFSGWHKQGDWRGKAEIWTSDVDVADSFEILVPKDPSVSDFWARLNEAIEILAVAEQRSIGYVLTDVINFGADVTRIRSDSDRTQFGEIPLNDLILLCENTRNMFASAAKSEINPKAEFKSKSPDTVREYVDKLKMGQTERGSYVLTVISKLTRDVETAHIPSALRPDPFERLVIKRLDTALRVVKEVVSSERRLRSDKEVFDAVSMGVSVNLCQAVINMQNAASGGIIEIGFTPSKTLSAPENTLAPVFFEARELPALENAIEKLKSSVYEDEVSLRGVVVGLEKGEGQDRGKVVIATYIEGKGRKVYAYLPVPLYFEAVKAHENNLSVRCSGHIKQVGRNYIFESLSRFVVEKPLTLFDEQKKV